MDPKIKKGFLFIILILLQSCSGGRIGNFFESSFKNVEELKIKKDIKNNLNNKKIIKSEENYKKIKNIKEPKIKEDTKNNLINKLVVKSEENYEKNRNIEEPITKVNIKKNVKKKIFIKPEAKLKNNKQFTNQNVSLQEIKYQPQSYKIIFILKDADPKDPIKNLSNILRNSDVNFEIEKIERFSDSKDKSIKSN